MKEIYKTLRHKVTEEYGAFGLKRIVSSKGVPVLYPKEITWQEVKNAGFENIKEYMVIGVAVEIM